MNNTKFVWLLPTCTMPFHGTLGTLGWNRSSSCWSLFTSILRYRQMHVSALGRGLLRAEHGCRRSVELPTSDRFLQRLGNWRTHPPTHLGICRRWNGSFYQQRSSLQIVSTFSASSHPFTTRDRSLRLHHPQCRTLANGAKATADKDVADGATKAPSYWEQKKAAKERRRELYAARQERKMRLKVRRAGKPKDTKKVEFHNFFIAKMVTDEHLDRKSRQAGLEWKIKVAVLLERMNVVLPDKEKWEIEYENLKAHLNQFGKQYPKELTNNFDFDQKRPMTDEELLELLPFTPAPRETEADATGNVHTTDRKLKTNIYLAVQEKSNDLWQLPTVDVKKDETLLDAARRAIPEQVGSDIDFWCPSNAPWSVHLTPYSEEERKTLGLYGCKTFFMKLQLDHGSVSAKDMTVKDFAWLDRDEMVDRVREQQGEDMSKLYFYML